VKHILLGVAIVLVGIGLLVVFLSHITTDLYLKMAFIGAGVGIVAIGVAFLGAWIAQKGDNKMRAIANLEFDEKVVAMENYLDEFSEPTFAEELLESEYKKFLWDLRAMTHVAKWADKNRRRESRQRLERITIHLAGKMDATRLNEVKRLSDQIWSD